MESLYTLAIATAVLVAIPGPNVALIIANTLRHGFSYGALTVLGTTIGIAVQLLLVVAGLALLLQGAASLMLWLKWLGVAYLLFLAWQSWHAPAEDLAAVQASDTPALPLFWQGLGLAVINPKTLAFNAAFLPQFIPVDSGPAGVALVATIYLSILFLGDMLWAAFAGAGRKTLGRVSHWRGKLTGGFLAAAGIGLALAGRHQE